MGRVSNQTIIFLTQKYERHVGLEQLVSGLPFFWYSVFESQIDCLITAESPKPSNLHILHQKRH